LQKTSVQMETIGSEEISNLFLRTHNQEFQESTEISLLSQKMKRDSALCAWLLKYGVRW